MKILTTTHHMTSITADNVTDDMIVVGVIDGQPVLRYFDNNHAANLLIINVPQTNAGYGPCHSTRELIDGQITVNHANLQAFPSHGIPDALRWLADELDSQGFSAKTD